MTTKFIAFFGLIEACGKEGCPVCRCLREDSLRYLDALMYEQVNDPDTRTAFQTSWGFCNWHAWMLKEILNSAPGVAILYDDLLRTALGRLRQLLVRISRGKLNTGWTSRLLRPRPRFPLLDARRRKADCIICQRNRSGEVIYLGTLLDFAGDPEFDRAFDRSSGVCLPHLLRLIELQPEHPRLEPVLTKIETKWRRLQDQLKRFIDKHDYRATEKFTHEESRSWCLAVEMLAGAPGLFGNELYAPRPAAVMVPPPTRDRSSEVPAVEQEIETLHFEKAKLELRLKELTDQFTEVSSRAAALHYRLWEVLEDRKVLEMNLSGEQASSRLLAQTVGELRKELDRLRAQSEAAREV